MIKRVNPFIILGALVLILVFLFLGVQSRKSVINQENSELVKYESRAKALKDLKSTWNTKKTISQLNTIVSNPSLKNKTNIKTLANKVTLTANGLQRQEIDLIVKKLLNEPFEIKKIDIKRINEKSIDLSVEVSK